MSVPPPPASAAPPPILSYFPVGRQPRPEQARAISEVEQHFQGGAPVVAFQGPTGIGKSYIGMTFARRATLQAEKTHLLTAQRVLQDQYAADFSPPEIEPVKGRSNYPCSLEPWRGDASRGRCRRVEHTAIIQQCLKFGDVESAVKFELSPEAHLCPYWAQLTTAVHAPVALFNFQSFLFQQRLGRFGPRNLMILDECHNAENVLLQFVEVVISDEALRLVDVRLDLTLKTPDQVLSWLDREQVDKRIRAKLGNAADTEEVASGLSPDETDKLRNLLTRLKDLRRFFEMTMWVVDVTEHGEEGSAKRTRKLRLRPVFVSPFAKELIFSKADRVLAMSATILAAGVWAKNLGIAAKNMAYVEAPCPFPVKNRPIYLNYAGDMGFKNQPETLPKLYSSINRILHHHQGQRGIIHAHSERIVKLIVETMRSPRFLHLDQFQLRDKSSLLKAHAARPDSVIVASAMHEGVDLKDDLSRFQIVAKIPWPMMEDAFVKARIKEDKWYMSYQTALKFCQSVGRSVRHDKDWANTYVLDSGFDHFLKQAAWLLPVWVKEAIVYRKP